MAVQDRKRNLCVKDGEERGFTAAEFKQAQADGWEKQYQYKVGKKKVYMAPSAAQAQDYERASKYPKSTKFGRQNPITERWNSDEQLVLWRAAWADVANRYLSVPDTKNASTTAAMLNVVCWSGLRSMRVWLPEPWRKRVLSLTGAN